MSQRDTDKNDKFSIYVNGCKGHQKGQICNGNISKIINVIRSTIHMGSFIIVSKSAQLLYFYYTNQQYSILCNNRIYLRMYIRTCTYVYKILINCIHTSNNQRYISCNIHLLNASCTFIDSSILSGYIGED